MEPCGGEGGDGHVRGTCYMYDKVARGVWSRLDLLYMGDEQCGHLLYMG